jgi:hypothetical protein
MKIEIFRDRGKIFLDRMMKVQDGVVVDLGESWETFPYFLRLHPNVVEEKVYKRDKKRIEKARIMAKRKEEIEQRERERETETERDRNKNLI